MEDREQLQSVIKSICKGAAIKISKILADEGIDAIEDLADLTSEDLKIMGIATVHAKTIVKKCKQIKLKIAVGIRDNVIGFVRVPRAFKLADLRRQIARDELPVSTSFKFTEDNAAITRKQEKSWDVDVYINDSENGGLCVIIEEDDKASRDKPIYSTDKRSPALASSTVAAVAVAEEAEVTLNGSPFFDPLPNLEPNFKVLPSLEDEAVLAHNKLTTADIIGSIPEKVKQSTFPESFESKSWASVASSNATAAKKLATSSRAGPDATSDTQVYIGNLIAKTKTSKRIFNDDELKNGYIYKFGHVVDYMRPVDHYAFVAFAYPESAEACVEEMNNLVIRDFRLVCRYATRHRETLDYGPPTKSVHGRVLLSDLPDEVKPKDVLRCFNNTGPTVANVVIRPTKRSCIVMFKTKASAEKAARNEVKINGVQVTVCLLNETNPGCM
eukprot:m.3883 g.3883  ORF g.3883 m.3883 type:complete len:443 (+) comp9914_c0_seq1:130-1458(+)